MSGRRRLWRRAGARPPAPRCLPPLPLLQARARASAAHRLARLLTPLPRAAPLTSYLKAITSVTNAWLRADGNPDYPNNPSGLGFGGGRWWYILLGGGTGLAVGCAKAVLGFDEYPSFIIEVRVGGRRVGGRGWAADGSGGPSVSMRSASAISPCVPYIHPHHLHTCMRARDPCPPPPLSTHPPGSQLRTLHVEPVMGLKICVVAVMGLLGGAPMVRHRWIDRFCTNVCLVVNH